LGGAFSWRYFAQRPYIDDQLAYHFNGCEMQFAAEQAIDSVYQEKLINLMG
jgi:hypothetical protein